MFIKKWKTGFLLLLGLSFALPLEASYRGELNQWTKSKQWYSTKNFYANIIWHATYFSPEFRRAFMQRHIKKKYLNAVEAARYIAEQEQDQAKFHEFFVGIYARKPYREFSLGKGSFWELILVTEKGEEIEPISVEFVDITPYEEIMFPYLNRWSRGYRVTYPTMELGSSFKLQLRSVIGASALKWRH